MKDALRIVFLGTPDFAVPSLDALVENGYNVVGVVTAPDKPAGRGMKLTTSAIKQYALENDIAVLQPDKLKSVEFTDNLRNLKADLQVVVAFRMLPEVVWNMPPLGTINVHASLLPNYRGAAPINWVLINGEQETGITTFKLDHTIDTGNILLQRKIQIGEKETAGELHDRLKIAGADLLIETINGYINGEINEKSQKHFMAANNDNHLAHAPRIFKETCRINWQTTTQAVYNLVRGLSPSPGAFTEVNGKIFKILKAELPGVPEPASAPGTMETDKKTYLRFACLDGYLYATEVQPADKKRMTAGDYLRGLQ